jgi:hypothetical protein
MQPGPARITSGMIIAAAVSESTTPVRELLFASFFTILSFDIH